MHSTLQIEIGETKQKVQIIKFIGEFDKAGHSDVRETLDQTVKDFQGSNLVFDFSSLRFINSEGIGYLMEIHTHLVNRDKKLVIVSPTSHVKDVFDAIGIGEIIDIYEDLESFTNK